MRRIKILGTGCPLDCAKNCLEQAGFITFEHPQLADMGLEKG